MASITINAASVAVVQEALYLLRQDETIDAATLTGSTVIGKKCAAALASAANEICDSFRWSQALGNDISSWAMPCRNALVYCIARELAIPIAGRMEDLKNIDALYRDKLLQAKLRDFETGKAAITDADIKQVFALITVTNLHGDGKMPSSIGDIVDRIKVIKDNARREVLLAQDWNFAKVVEHDDLSEPSASIDREYPFCVPYPAAALRLISVGRVDGDRNEWKVEDHLILAKYPISTVRYTTDITDLTSWSAFAYSAYIHRLAADVARTVMNNPQDAALQEQAYALALENARLRDTRESSTPTDAWGENFYAKQMTGGHRRALDI